MLIVLGEQAQLLALYDDRRADIRYLHAHHGRLTVSARLECAAAELLPAEYEQAVQKRERFEQGPGGPLARLPCRLAAPPAAGAEPC